MAEPTVKEFIRARVYDSTKAIFTDAELQVAMDLYKTRLLYVPMATDDNERTYWAKGRNFLENASLWNSNDEDSTSLTEYTPDIENLIEGVFEFDTAPDETSLYLLADSYNAYAVISELWLAIASTKYEMVSAMIGASQETNSQIYQQAMKQHEAYKKMAFPPKGGRLKRRYV